MAKIWRSPAGREKTGRHSSNTGAEAAPESAAQRSAARILYERRSLQLLVTRGTRRPDHTCLPRMDDGRERPRRFASRPGHSHSETGGEQRNRGDAAANQSGGRRLATGSDRKPRPRAGRPTRSLHRESARRFTRRQGGRRGGRLGANRSRLQKRDRCVHRQICRRAAQR